MNQDIILEVKDLSVSFYTDNRKNNAIRNVSFVAQRGKTLCIVGESGCGKSVSASAILRLLPELSRIENGEIKYYGREEPINIEKVDPDGDLIREIRGGEIAMIFQDPMTALNPVYTVGYQISEMLLEHNKDMKKDEAMKKSVELLSAMGIPQADQRVNEYPHQFSGGMRQRAMIAMAMSCNPKILLADEPTTALDVTVQAQIFELMDNLKKDYDAAIVLITHDMGVVTELADNVSVMYMGYVVEDGTVDEVLRTPAHPYTKALLASIPILGRGRNQKIEPIRGSTPDPFNRPPGCQFEPRCDYATEKCREAMPEREFISGEHNVRCYCYKEVLKDE
ncbi:MAG: ABC transporter ATP-binding protein [Christensenellaceae bacterium]|jgi:oligopeptide/dipeptide ABC transporter ATP-binding protein|nr:ABC transporter ATP-binding protein [Christensenellaceae bacterium]